GKEAGERDGGSACRGRILRLDVGKAEVRRQSGSGRLDSQEVKPVIAKPELIQRSGAEGMAIGNRELLGFRLTDGAKTRQVGAGKRQRLCAGIVVEDGHAPQQVILGQVVVNTRYALVGFRGIDGVKAEAISSRVR